MSGWDASSRPSWDPQGGPGENTQSFGVPDFPEDNGGFPSSSSPGTPPAIFLQDYDQNDVVQDDFGSNDFRIDFGSGGYGSGDSRQDGLGYAGPGYADPGPGHPGPGPGHPGPGYPGPGPGQGDFSRDGFGPQDDARRGYGHEDDFGYREYGQRGPAAPQDNSRQDYSRQDYSRQDYSRQDYSRQDNSRQDYPRQGPARDEASGSYPAGPVDSRGQADGEYAARMDPALRDFFAAPPPARQDRGQPGSREQQPGPRGYPGQGLGQGPGQGAPGGPPGYGQANGYRQPNDPMQPAPPRWDNAAPRPGSRSARHQETHVGGTGRDGRSTAVIVIAVVLVLGIAVGAYLLWRSKPAAPAAQNVPTTAPTSGSNVAKNPSPAATPAGLGAATTRYTLKTPATAGGYTKVTSVPAAVKTAAGTTSAAVKGAAVKDGGKVAGQVTAGYQLSGGQVLAFTGFTGTFNPAKVMASVAALGTNSQTAAAGPHGGKLACYGAPGTPKGTVCVWVTTTTMGVTEFFGSDGPEVVTDQSKAAADAVKLRSDVEVSKS